MGHECKIYANFLGIIDPLYVEYYTEQAKKKAANDDDEPLKAA